MTAAPGGDPQTSAGPGDRPARKPRRKELLAMPEMSDQFPEASGPDVTEETNPFTSKDWRMLIYAWADVLVRVFIILGGIFAIYQYSETRKEKRVQQTLQLVELWDQPDFQNAQLVVKDRLASLNNEFAGQLGQNPSQEELAVYYRQVGLQALSVAGPDMPLEEFRARYEKVLYFLNRLAFCVDGNLCEQSVADAFFYDYASSFWRYFSGYAERERQRGVVGYATAIENYVTEERNGSIFSTLGLMPGQDD